MRKFLCISACVFLLQIMHAQKLEIQLSPKPAILVNGNNCSILNTIWSCSTRVCDSIVITAGDSVEFYTYTEIFLNTDTAYWIEWNFPGSTNYPDSVYHHYPYQTPHCIYPRWDIPGDYYCDVFYNGWLSAYSFSDCYPVPSHWIVHVQVDPNPNGIEVNDHSTVTVSPNPSHGIFKLENLPAEVDELEVRDLTGRIISVNKNTRTLDLSFCPAGIYFLSFSGFVGAPVFKLVIN